MQSLVVKPQLEFGGLGLRAILLSVSISIISIMQGTDIVSVLLGFVYLLLCTRGYVYYFFLSRPTGFKLDAWYNVNNRHLLFLAPPMTIYKPPFCPCSFPHQYEMGAWDPQGDQLSSCGAHLVFIFNNLSTNGRHIKVVHTC
jgi:hypothetical protein